MLNKLWKEFTWSVSLAGIYAHTQWKRGKK